MNASSPGDEILIPGYNHDKGKYHIEQTISIDKRLYFKGIHGKPTMHCKHCDVIFRIVSAVSVSFENIRFSQFLGEETSNREGREVTVFQVYSTAIRVSNCYFDSIPYVLNYRGGAVHNIVCYNNVFKRAVKAIQVTKTSYRQHLFIRDCHFIGEPSVSGEAVIVQHDTSVDQHVDPMLFMKVYNSNFSFLKNSICVEAYHIMNTTVIVDGSRFMHNRFKKLTKFGRMSYIERSSGITVFSNRLSKRMRLKLIVRNSKFINNTSAYGGSISIDCGNRADLVIEECIFKDNVAIMSGGALQATGNCEVTLRASSFISNRCDRGQKKPEKFSSRLYDPYGIGGALMLFAYENAPFDPFHYRSEARISDCLFQFNSAEYSGGAIYANSHILNIENTVMESSLETQPRNIDSQLIRCKYRCNLINVSFIVGNAANSQAAALFGESTIALRLDEASTFMCPRGSTLVYNKLRSLEKSTIVSPPNMPLRKNFMMFVFFCFNCPPDHYNLKSSFLVNSTLSNESCQKCPPGGVCRAGTIRSKSNFWGFVDKGRYRVSFIQLQKGYGCLWPQCRGIDSCANGRTGTLCATCKIGLSENMLSRECIKNEECNFMIFWALAFVLFFIYLIFFIFRKEIASTLTVKRLSCFSQDGSNKKELLPRDSSSIAPPENEGRSTNSNENIKNRRDMNTAVVKIVFYFFQAESLLTAFRYNYDKNIKSHVGGWLSSFFNFNFFQSQAVSTCAIYNATPIDKILIRFCFVVSLFLAMVVIYTLAWLRSKGTPDAEQLLLIKKGKLTFTNKIVVASFEIFLLNYASFAEIIFKLLRCVEINGALHLHIQGNIKCYRDWQYLLVVVGLVWALPFCICIFILPWLMVRRRIKRRGLLAGCIFPLLLIMFACLKSKETRRGDESGGNSSSNGEGQEEEMEAEDEVGAGGDMEVEVDVMTEVDVEAGLDMEAEGEVQEDVQVEKEIEVKAKEEMQEEEVEAVLQVQEVEGKRDAQLYDTALAEILKNRVDPFSLSVNKNLYFSWEGVYILRRLLLVAFSSFITDPVYKLYAMLLAQVIFLLHHLHLKPYAAKSMNHLETFSLTMLVLINSMNLLSAYNYSQGYEADSSKHQLLLIFWWMQVVVEALLPMLFFFVLILLIAIYLLRMFAIVVRALLRTFCM